MAKEEQSKRSLAFAIFTLGVVPFLVTLFKFLSKTSDLDAPITMKDLLVVLGIQAAVAAFIIIKILFFNYPLLG